MISENDVSLRFKLSRTPVREAFIALSKEALITVIPQKGSMVSRIDFARVEQELFLRENLEPAALKQFLKNHNPSHLAELEKYIELQAEAVHNREFEKLLQYDNLFHKTFFGSQKVAWEVIENMCGHYHRFRLLTICFQEGVKDIVKEHKLLFQAIREKNSAKALALLKSHIHKIDEEEPMLRRLFPEYFVDSSKTEPFKVDFGGLPLLVK
jgi:DNA-binding GntR family transcriptional regulator